MQLGAIFVTSFVIAFSGAAMPGPVLTATIAESMRRGPVAGPLIVAGHAALELVLVVLVVVGLAPVLADVRFFAAASLVGSIMLAVMAYRMARSIPSLSLAVETGRAPGSNLMAEGALLSLSTPYWSLWWATIGLGYILASMPLGALGVAAWGTLWAVPVFVVYGALYCGAADSRWHEAGHGTAFKTRWMADALYQVASFMVLRRPTVWRWSHSRHH
ncbi:MAG TPA: LysE family transporter, partial [Deltaproteobacteria bacterium]|nr:LysE family transporter [Deltaproteobacteria bacterium]